MKKANMKKLRILCLHGYHGNAVALRSQMRALTESAGAPAEFVHVDAPSLQHGDHGWWHAQRGAAAATGDPGVAASPARYQGWGRTRDRVVSLFHRAGPFDGIFGFSRGAALAGLLVGLRAPDGLPGPEKPLAFGFAIMVGGFPASAPELARFYEDTPSYCLPSLHILGRSDRIVAPESSRRLAAHFPGAIVLEHDAGHIIAATHEVSTRFAAFLRQQAETTPPACARKATGM
jgi:pimeloyl-ACP methyl ester carboxylesterase